MAKRETDDEAEDRERRARAETELEMSVQEAMQVGSSPDAILNTIGFLMVQSSPVRRVAEAVLFAVGAGTSADVILRIVREHVPQPNYPALKVK